MCFSGKVTFYLISMNIQVLKISENSSFQVLPRFALKGTTSRIDDQLLIKRYEYLKEKSNAILSLQPQESYPFRVINLRCAKTFRL